MKRLGGPAVRKSELWGLKSWIRFVFFLLFMVGLWVTAWPLQASVAFSRKCSCLSLSLYTTVCVWAQGASAWIQAGRVWKVRRRNSFFTLHTYIYIYVHTCVCINLFTPTYDGMTYDFLPLTKAFRFCSVPKLLISSPVLSHGDFQVLPANAGDIRGGCSIPGSGRSPGEGHGSPLQYSCLENPHGQRSLAGKESTQLKRLSMHTRLSHDAGQRQPPLRFDIPTLTTDLFFAFRTVFNQLCEIVSTLL